MSDGGDYVLGTEADEIERLGLQHRVWRERVLDAWRRAGIGRGQTVIDVGAGPGWASADLAEIVGPEGRVIALERSESFLAALRRRGLSNVEVRAHDVAAAPFGERRRMRRGAAGCSRSSRRRSAPSGTLRAR